MKLMHRLASLLLPLSLLLVAAPALAAEGAVKTAKKEGVGTFLVDAKGMTLYTFKNDTPGASRCEGPCAEKWPVFYREKVEPAAGLSAGDFATITRSDGKKQTTYKGMPLYYFSGDKGGGDTAGQGIRDIWYAATP